MSHTLQPYPAYKDSGVPWLGQVPGHWELKRTKQLFQERVDKGFPDEPLLTATQSRGVIPKSLYETRTVTAQKGLETLKLVKVGDFVISLRSFQGGIEYAYYQGIISPAYTVLTPRAGTDAGYYKYFLKSSLFIKALANLFVTGIREGQNINYPKLSCEYLPIPPLEEQTQIARFLAYQEQCINRYIRNKRRVIALLNEQKQAIIQRAVTRGLDPTAPLKPSGVEWLGDIPQHWRFAQVRGVAKVVRGGSPRPAGSPLYFNGKHTPWITVGELTKDNSLYLISTETFLTEIGAQQSRVIQENTLLLSNSGATLGIPKICMIKGCINDGVAAFQGLRDDMDIKYFYFYWLSQTKHLLSWVSHGAQPNLNTQIIGGWPVTIPPKREQEKIVEFVTSETALIEQAISRLHREIDLIREYRTRLIADVVTGKLDVRGVAVPDSVPDEPLVDELLPDPLADDAATTEPEEIEEAA